MTSKQRDPFTHLTITDLTLVARARGLDVPGGADRNEILALLSARDTPTSVATPPNRKPSPTAERPGWWTYVSLPELGKAAREHGIDVPAGTHRRELVDLLIERDVPGPSQPSSVRMRRR